jgi:hypothetical protein
MGKGERSNWNGHKTKKMLRGASKHENDIPYRSQQCPHIRGLLMSVLLSAERNRADKSRRLLQLHL